MNNIKESNFIKIPNNFVQEYKYTNETVFVYALLQKNLTIRGKIIFNLDWLFKELKIDKNNTYSQKKIKSILKQLEIDNCLQFDCNIMEINKNKIIFATIKDIDDLFVKISDDEFDTIKNYAGEKSIYGLFCVYANLKSRISNNLCCYPSFKKIRKDTGIESDDTLTDYLTVLKNELKLILYDNPGLGIIKDAEGKEKVKQLNNIYVLNNENAREILDEAIEYRKQQLSKYYEKISNNKEVNKKRSESMKKHWEKIKNIKEESFINNIADNSN